MEFTTRQLEILGDALDTWLDLPLDNETEEDSIEIQEIIRKEWVRQINYNITRLPRKSTGVECEE